MSLPRNAATQKFIESLRALNKNDFHLEKQSPTLARLPQASDPDTLMQIWVQKILIVMW